MAALDAAMVAMGEKNAAATPPATPSKSSNRAAKEEKIFVTVRVRPLSNREIEKRDVLDWECPDEHTVAYKHPMSDRSPYPARYTFDRVFGPNSSTKVVYEDGAKDVALSALNGINSTIFAYGQTSSGKTFTMRGVVENAVQDIYSVISKNDERDFILKISGMEIYNEVVRDLLNSDSGPLRLLDDPERGTIVEKLVETIVRDGKHLRQVLAVCEAQRQVGETTLNEASSRSHQIIRLTIQSTPRAGKDGPVNAMVATLNFVDLAGSERASQTLADGSRLKEGCHINRSLLTLSTVIRKLSGNNRTKAGHIPYRDSKLTRILQLSLGGNARTAIICTMSPAHAHVEQSRNTLSFATRAKEVTNSAHVNLVVSDKDLVKQLQKEVARLEAELRVPEAALSSEALLHEKDLQIQKMESEMKELVRQRDAVKAQLDNALLKLGRDELDDDQCNVGDELESKSAPLMLVQEIRKLEKLQDELGEDASRALEALQKEVECLRLAQAGMNQDAAATIGKLQAEIKILHAQRVAKEAGRRSTENGLVCQEMTSSLKDEIHRLQAIGTTDKTGADVAIATLEKHLESVQMSLDKMVLDSPSANKVDASSPTKFRTPTRKKKGNLPPTMGSSSRQLFSSSPPCSPRTRSICFENNENTPPRSSENTPTSAAHRRNNSVDIKKMQNLFKTAAEDNIKSVRAYVTELKERVAKLQYQKQLLVCQVLELESNGGVDQEAAAVSPDGILLHMQFEKQRMHIIGLWDICQVSIVHRSQFYLLFRGDPADAIYMEVEFRRLLWLQDQFSKAEQQQHQLQSPGLGEEDSGSFAASYRALKREREGLAKRMRRLSPELREELLLKWDVPLDSKQRKLQLADKVWTDPLDLEHIQESAETVAKIVGFWEPGCAASKEMFALNFAPPSGQKGFHFGWNSISTMLNL